MFFILSAVSPDRDEFKLTEPAVTGVRDGASATIGEPMAEAQLPATDSMMQSWPSFYISY